MDVCEAKRLKALEEGNTRLKKPLPDRMLDAAAVRELLEKMVGPPPRAKPSRTSGARWACRSVRPAKSSPSIQWIRAWEQKAEKMRLLCYS
jgi:hypothetical protein